ncbi:MAG: PDZ domain-containing protein [Candidatus Brocadiales bacterium]
MHNTSKECGVSSRHEDTVRSRHLLTAYCLLLTAHCFMASPDVYASNLFTGLIVSQGDQGVKVVEIYPRCPSERAGIMVGDLILEIDGQKIKTLDEFARMSKAMGDRQTEASLLLIRKGKLHNLQVVIYSTPVFKEWQEKVLPPPEGSVGGVSLFQYYVEKGKAKLEENKQGGSLEAQLTRNQEAIRYLFYALHYAPTEVGVVLLAADTHMNMAGLYLKSGQTALAVENYARAAGLYEKCSKRHVAEEELERILSHLQEVEKELLSLLPPEEQGPVSAEKATAESLPIKGSPR